jgi:hypothetical protein
LPDPPNLVPPRDDSLLAILHDELVQRVHQVRPQLLEPLVVRAQRQLRQRFLRAGRGLLAVNPQRRARGAFAPCPPTADAPSSGATLPSFGASVSPFKMAMSSELFI